MESTRSELVVRLICAHAFTCWCGMHMYAAPILRSLLIRARKPGLVWGGNFGHIFVKLKVLFLGVSTFKDTRVGLV